MNTALMKIIFFLLTTISISAQSYDGLYRVKVKTLDSTIETLYSVISGDKGERRNWELFRYLFADNAQLAPITTLQSGRKELFYMTPDDYVTRSGAYLEANGFFEKEIFRVTEQYGALTHLFSTYESYRSSKDTTPFARGINSIQCMFDGSRWWILNITWKAESESNPIPKKYLPE